MHVLFITQQWAPEQGVSQRRGRWMVDQLLETGHRVTIVAPPPHYPNGKLLSTRPEDQPRAVSVPSAQERLFRARFLPHTASIYSRVLDQAVVSFTSLTTALKATQRHPVDVVLATAPPLPTVFTAFILARLRSVPFVVDLRDAWPELVRYIPNADPGSTLKALIKRAIHPAFKIAGKLFGRVIGNADGIISTSTWHERQLSAFKKQRTAVVSNLPLVELIGNNHGDNQRREHRKLPPGELNVLYTGTVGRAQGLENAVEAAAIAQRRGIKINLRIIGDGAHLKHVKEAATRTSANVECFGRIPHEKVSEHYEWADTLLVHLQDWKPLEWTMPSKMFEAIASEKHVTAAVNGEAAEFLQRFGRGDTAPAMDPAALADLWIDLAQNRTDIREPTDGKTWLLEELERTNPSQTFISFIEDIARESN